MSPAVRWWEEMSAWFNADAPNAVAVSFNGSPARMYGILGAPGDLDLSSIAGIGQGAQFPGVQNLNRTVLIRTDQTGALVPGSDITVDGTDYTVKQVQPLEDGLITLVVLA